jgi:3-deoxy-D-manno-octulosonic-acid transferase
MNIPLYLLNVRISMKSMRRFIFVNKIFNIFPFSIFHLVVTPSEEIKNFVVKLGANIGNKNFSVFLMTNRNNMYI